MVQITPPKPPAKDPSATDREEQGPEVSALAPSTNHLGFIKAWWGSLAGATRFALTVAGALATLSGAYNIIMNNLDPSHTKFEVNSSDPKLVHLKVWNTGHNTSRLVAYRLKFPSELMIENTDLTLATGNTIIEPQPSAQAVDMTTTELIRSCNSATQRRYLKPDIENALSKYARSLVVTVEIDVQESGRFPEFHRNEFIAPRNAKVTVDLMTTFILGRIPDVDDEDVPCKL